MVSTAIVLLALVGLAISSYFTAVAYRWIRPDAAWVPRVCRLDEGTCASVVHTPRARVLGVPNSVLGQLYYLALIAGVASGWLWVGPWRQLALLAAAMTVLLGAYLTYSLLYVTRVPCRLCFTSHALNAVLALVLWLGPGAWSA